MIRRDPLQDVSNGIAHRPTEAQQDDIRAICQGVRHTRIGGTKYRAVPSTNPNSPPMQGSHGSHALSRPAA